MTKPRQRCKDCGRQADVDVRVSKRGLCRECAAARMAKNVEATTQRAGALYDKWYANWKENSIPYKQAVDSLMAEVQSTSHLPPSG